MIKFINEKLKGLKDSIENEPIIKGVRYNIKNLLFKYFSNIY